MCSMRNLADMLPYGAFIGMIASAVSTRGDGEMGTGARTCTCGSDAAERRRATEAARAARPTDDGREGGGTASTLSASGVQKGIPMRIDLPDGAMMPLVGYDMWFFATDPPNTTTTKNSTKIMNAERTRP